VLLLVLAMLVSMKRHNTSIVSGGAAAGETWEVGQEDAREDYLEAYKNVFWLPRDLYFPVHEYPSERADEDGED